MERELVSRRNFLKVAGLTGAGIGLAACRSGSETPVAPAEEHITAAQILEIQNVKDFGAKGDGQSNDALAIQAAINAGKTIYIPPGIYLLNAGLTLPEGKVLFGSGPANSILRVNADVVGVFLTEGTGHIEQLQLQSNVNTTKPAIHIEKTTGPGVAANWYLRDLYIRANPDNSPPRKFDTGIFADRAHTALLERITIDNLNNFGIKLTRVPHAYLISHCNVANVKTGIYIENAGSGVIIGGAVQGRLEKGIEIKPAGTDLSRYELIGIHFELENTPGSTCLVLDTVRCATVIGGLWSNNGTNGKAISISNSVVSLVNLAIHSPIEINGENSTVTFVGGEIDISQIKDTTQSQRTQYLGVFDYPNSEGTYAKRLKIGDGVAIRKHLSATAPLDFGIVPAQDMVERTIDVTNSLVGDTVIATPKSDPGIRLTWSAYVSASHKVTVRLMNGSGSNVQSAIRDWRVDVWQH
jgi:hypothetical protein